MSYSSVWNVSGCSGTSMAVQWRAVVRAKTTVPITARTSTSTMDRITHRTVCFFFGAAAVAASAAKPGYTAVAVAKAAVSAGCPPVPEIAAVPGYGAGATTYSAGGTDAAWVESQYEYQAWAVAGSA